MTTQHLIYAVLALQVADVLSTLAAFRNGATEANPVMRKLIDLLGAVPGLVLPKVVFAAAIWYWRPLFSVEALALVCAAYTAVVLNNIRIARSRA